MPPTNLRALQLLAPCAPQIRNSLQAGPDFNVVNPATGHRATRQRSAEGAKDAPVEFEFTVPARSAGAHRPGHTRISETFTVVAGQLLVEVGERGHIIVLHAGETGTIAPGTPHEFRNASDAVVVFRFAVTPGGDFENFIRFLCGLALDGRTDAAGMLTNFWQLVLISKLGDVHVPGSAGGTATTADRWPRPQRAPLRGRAGSRAPYDFARYSLDRHILTSSAPHQNGGPGGI